MDVMKENPTIRLPCKTNRIESLMCEVTEP